MKSETEAENWQKIKEIFSSALEKDAGDRAAFVAASCAGNANLQAEVLSWLDSHTEAEEFIESPAFSVNTILAEDSEAVGKCFGNYKIISEIGRGGMGTVFLAMRADGEFDQQVALKIVRQTIVDAETENRFRRERQILASLNHPNIAKLSDGGVSGAGEPYLVMEYVEGEPLNEFVDARNLSVKDRLKLFLKICSAVSFAHRNLIVHRDLKPSNILITNEGEPKLLDFGLAKILDLETDATQTATAFRAFTPSYASPEQLRGGNVSTASDVYSLGIVLYELLTGKRPFDYQGKSLEQIIKTVSETEPVKPSRIQNPKSEIRNLKGDIDNIISVALRNEPERRYKSIEAFAEDIERHLQGLPVSARPNTFRYRVGKFVKRNKISVAVGVLLILSLLGGMAATVRQKQFAERESVKAEIVNTFLQDLLSASNPETDLSLKNGRDTTVKDLLDEASRRLETEDLSSQPEIKAELQRIVGTSYLAQGQYDLAEKNINAALEAQTRIYGENSVETLKTLVVIADLWLSKGDNAKADNFFRQRLSILRAEQKKGNINADYLFTALHNFALLLRAQGDSKEAEALVREALDLRSQTSSDIKNTVGIAESVLALTLSDQGEFDEAEKFARAKVAEVRRLSNAETSELCGGLTMLGSILMEKGEYEEAEKNLLEAETSYRKLYHQTYLALGDNLRLQAQNFYFQNKLAEARTKIDETLKIYKETGAQYINYPTALTVQGLILSKEGNHAEAEKVLREAVRIRTVNLPRENFLRALSVSALGEYLTAQKRYEEAEPLLLESFENLKASQGADNPRTRLALQRLNKLYKDRQSNLQPDLRTP